MPTVKSRPNKGMGRDRDRQEQSQSSIKDNEVKKQIPRCNEAKEQSALDLPLLTLKLRISPCQAKRKLSYLRMFPRQKQEEYRQ